MAEQGVVDLLRAIQQAQSQYIEDAEPGAVFDSLLSNLLTLTQSEYGFIGEVLTSSEGRPYLRTHAITNVAWNEETRRFYEENAPTGLEFHNLETLFGAVLTSEAPVIANDPAADPRAGGLPQGHPPLRAFLGIPFHAHHRMIGMFGIANRPGGYDAALVAHLEPFIATCAGLIRAYRNAQKRKRAEEERHEAEIHMHRVQKLESLGVLAGGIAHDFNNLLSSVLGNAELALNELDGEDPAYGLVHEIQRSSLRAAELTQQLQAYTGKSRSSIETVDLSQLVADMANLLRTVVSHVSQMRIEAALKPLWIRSAPTQIRQLVMNLITNASEAMAERGGTVTIRTGSRRIGPKDLGDQFSIGEPAEGEYAYVEVSDTGCGIPEEDLERIFDPFYSTKQEGRGLGLASALGIARGQGAVLTVASTVGVGTTFTAFVPAASAPARVAAREASSEAGRGSRGTVLVVDDDEAVARVAGAMLRQLGFDVLTAANGGQAVEMLGKDLAAVTAVLLDATMPLMDGEKTFDALRAIRNDVPVLFYSGYSEHDATRLLSGKSSVGFLEKPFALASLKRGFAALLRG